MMTSKNFAKIFGPVLLLTASLSLPAVSTAAPAPDNDKGRKEQKAKENRKHKQEQQRENAKHRAEQQRENAKHRAEQQRENAKHRAEQHRVAERQPVYRQPAYQPVAQRRANPNRSNRPWNGWERGRGNGAFVLDGTFVDQQYGCQLIREHSGRVIPIVGNGGGIRKGDHVRLSGRVDNSTVCGPAFRVTEVQNIWGDTGHRNVIFDRRQDGDFDGSLLEDDEYRNQGRYPDQYRNGRRDNRYNDRNDDRYNDRNDGRNDDRYDDDYRGNGRLISVDGRLGGNSDCPSLRASNGEVFGLEGDLNGRDYGDSVRVVGFLGSARSSCGYNRTISVHEVNGR